MIGYQNIEVIESKVWRHKTTGRTASIYGACPASYTPGDMQEDWEIVTRGYTWRVTDHTGRITVGLGRQPVATREAAERIKESLRY